VTGNGKNNPSDNELEQRRASLEDRLKDRQKAARPAKVSSTSGLSGIGNAMRLSSEFIAAILVGAGIGYLIDTFAGTTPWAMIILLLLGFVAGVLNVLRASGEIADPYKKGWANDPKAAAPESGGKTDTGKTAQNKRDDLYDDDDDW